MITRSLFRRFNRRAGARLVHEDWQTSPPARWAADYAAALADPARPAAERARDAARLPAELLAFAQVSPGREGRRLHHGRRLSRPASSLPRSARRAASMPSSRPSSSPSAPSMATDQNDGRSPAYDNVVAVCGLRTPRRRWPEPLDTIITVQNFHDLYNKVAPAGTGRGGGAQPLRGAQAGRHRWWLWITARRRAPARHCPMRCIGSTRSTVIEAFTTAGFRLEADSDLYARPGDPRTANVFDPAIRGQTDQFTLRFRKPG